jgi:hypothetical protein
MCAKASIMKAAQQAMLAAARRTAARRPPSAARPRVRQSVLLAAQGVGAVVGGVSALEGAIAGAVVGGPCRRDLGRSQQ